MAKYLLNFLFIFLMLTSLSYARDPDAQLKREFGQDLTHAPFFLRFSFEKTYNIPWMKSYYAERKDFLLAYEKQVAKDKTEEKLEARQESNDKKERLRQKKFLLQRDKNRLRAQQEEDKAEQREYKERQKDFNNLLKQQHEELKQLIDDANQGH